MGDPVGDIIGDYEGFAAMQHERLLARGIDIGPYALSHLAVRVPEWDQYVHLRTLLERHATANHENVWNGRPISKIVLATPLEVLGGKSVSLIELIPPVHQRVYRMGLEHLGVVVGEDVDAFSRDHRAALTSDDAASVIHVCPVPIRGGEFNPASPPGPCLCSCGRPSLDARPAPLDSVE
jgi:predicted metalloenzyme YecM